MQPMYVECFKKKKKKSVIVLGMEMNIILSLDLQNYCMAKMHGLRN